MTKLKGTVTLDLETYNGMMQKIMLLENSIEIPSISSTSSENPIIKINMNILKPILTEVLSNSEYSNSYKIVEGTLYAEHVYGALEKKEV